MQTKYLIAIFLAFSIDAQRATPPGGATIAGGAAPGGGAGGAAPGGGAGGAGGAAPGGGGGGQEVSGSEPSTECTVTEGQCSHDGSSNSMTRALTYQDGIFSGNIITNQCANNNRWGQFGTSGTAVGGHTASCVKQTFPAPAYAGGKKAAPLRGILGYSISGGVDIYGPFENGFKEGMACTNGKGTCDAGLDVLACETTLKQQCGIENFKSEMMMDSCGGHAQPYHYHLDLACDYDHGSQGHSALIGVALDGRGIYGLYETTGVKPSNLDKCGGHVGDVPAHTVGGVTYPATKNVYHYHTQTEAPFTLGCFGPVDSVDACKALYPDTCNTGYSTFDIADGKTVRYDTDCPCFEKSLEELAQDGASSGAENYEAWRILSAGAAAAVSALFYF